MKRRRRLLLCGILLAAPGLGPRAEGLGQAWGQALARDHSLKAAQQERLAAGERLESARAARLPGVSLAAGYQALDHAPTARAAFANFPVGESRSLSYQAEASLPLYTGGRIGAGIAAADATLGAARAKEHSAAQDLKMAVAEAYVAVLRATRALEVARSHVVSLEGHARDVRNIYGQGMVSRNDLLAAEVALADARQEAIKAQNGLDLARSAYNRLLGRPLGQAVTLEELSPEPVAESLEALGEQALLQRSELVALRRRQAATRSQAAAVRAKDRPQVALSGGYAFEENRYQLHQGRWAVKLGLEWQLFDGGAVRHEAAASERQAAALQEEYDDLAGRIALEVRQAWLDLHETHRRIEVTEQAIAQAEENLKVNRDRYENGLSTNTEVLDAETLRTRSQNNHANAVYDAVLAALRLRRAVGRL